MPTKPEVRMILRVVLLIQCFGLDVELDLRRQETDRARCNAEALYKDGATLDHLRESVATLEDTERIARQVFGGAHPLTVDIEDDLRTARAALREIGAS